MSDGATPHTRVVDSTAWGLALSLAVLTAASISAVAFAADAPLIRADLGLSTVGVGAMTSAIYVGAASSSVAGGWLTDRRGPAPVLIGAMFLLAGGCAVSRFADSIPMLFTGIVITGLGYGWVNPPTNIISNPISLQRRALSMSVKQTGIPLGGTLAGVLVSPLAEAFGWRISLFLPIALCTALALTMALWCPRGTGDRGFDVDYEVTVRLRLPGAWAFGLLMNGVQGALFAFLTLFLTEERRLSPSAAGAGLSLMLLGGIVGRPVWGWISDHFHRDRVRVLQATAFIAGVALIVLAVAPLAVDVAVLPIIGMSAVGWNGAFIATVAEAARTAETVGFDTGVALLMVSLGPVLLPPVVGALAGSRTGWALAWSVCAVLGLGCAVIMQFSRRVAGPTPVQASSRYGVTQ